MSDEKWGVQTPPYNLKFFFPDSYAREGEI